MRNEPVCRRSSVSRSTSTGPEEGVALVAGVLAGGVGELAAQVVFDLGEAVAVVGIDPDRRRRWERGAATDVDGTVVVHLAGQAPADLDRAQPALEDAGEGTLDHVLELALEALETHEGQRYPARQAGPGPIASLCSLTREWRNLVDAQDSGSCVRKDVGVQVPPRARASPSATLQSIAFARVTVRGRGTRPGRRLTSSVRPRAERLDTTRRGARRFPEPERQAFAGKSGAPSAISTWPTGKSPIWSMAVEVPFRGCDSTVRWVRSRCRRTNVGGPATRSDRRRRNRARRPKRDRPDR